VAFTLCMYCDAVLAVMFVVITINEFDVYIVTSINWFYDPESATVRYYHSVVQCPIRMYRNGANPHHHGPRLIYIHRLHTLHTYRPDQFAERGSAVIA